ncbi:hypothetical protein KUTeg_000610 [Tegillarca granosa]|uniref:Carnitinyl-CoA dehydratase n=1 Tax=Tegillarca granosa TaxID=220873 RepID=A0ABQ9FY55_TEGGR|nr:hypothetical protein KUTeg_000610 [Tegillarca granosa]
MIAINRPENRNAIDPPTAKLLYEAFKTFESDKESIVAVLHGKGGHFCAGWDLKALSKADPSSLPDDPKTTEYGPIGPSRMMFTKPVIASVSGYAVAGVPLVDGGTARLPQLIGLSRALDMILTGRPVEAKEAYEFGLANRIAKTGTGLGVAVNLAFDIARFPQRCMNTDRKSAYYSTYNAKSIEDALQYEFMET